MSNLLKSLERLQKRLNREAQKFAAGEHNVLSPDLDMEDWQTASQEGKPDAVEELLKKSPWLAEEVKAGRVSLSAAGNTVRFHYAPSYYLHQAEQIASNAWGLAPHVLASVKEMSCYKGYFPDAKTDSERAGNEAWASNLAHDYEDRLAARGAKHTHTKGGPGASGGNTAARHEPQLTGGTAYTDDVEKVMKGLGKRPGEMSFREMSDVANAHRRISLHHDLPALSSPKQTLAFTPGT